MPQISVIVPVYKVEKYIHRCVDSVLSQSFRDFELILVDDGSPDTCGTICDEYAAMDSRIIVIHQENGGLSAARNAGIDWAFANSDSQWLTFVDSDDWIHPQMLERLYTRAIDFSADLSVCGLFCFSCEEDLRSVPQPQGDGEIFTGKVACTNLYKMNGKVSIEACSKLYSKYLFLNLRFPVGKIHEDQAVVPLVLYNARYVVTTRDLLYSYYRREDSITGISFSERRFDDIDALNSCILFFRNHGETEIAQLAEHRREFLLGLYNLYACKAKVHRKIPMRHRMTAIQAVKKMEERASFDQVTWYMAKVYPGWVKPYSYWCKVRKILGIPISK